VRGRLGTVAVSALRKEGVVIEAVES
jgi:hypothetical protein